jgi:hypothetical protein
VSEAVVRKLFSELNSGKLGDTVAEPLRSRLNSDLEGFRSRYPGVRLELTNVVEVGTEKTGFQYQGTVRNATWTGTGFARFVKDQVADLQVKEDYWARDLQLGEVVALDSESITGTWTCGLFGVTGTLDLNESTGSNNFSGTLSIPGFGTYQLTGTNNYPNVELQGNANGQQITFVGTWTGSNQITGNMPGISNNVVLNRET